MIRMIAVLGVCKNRCFQDKNYSTGREHDTEHDIVSDWLHIRNIYLCLPDTLSIYSRMAVRWMTKERYVQLQY